MIFTIGNIKFSTQHGIIKCRCYLTDSSANYHLYPSLIVAWCLCVTIFCRNCTVQIKCRYCFARIENTAIHTFCSTGNVISSVLVSKTICVKASKRQLTKCKIGTSICRWCFRVRKRIIYRISRWKIIYHACQLIINSLCIKRNSIYCLCYNKLCILTFYACIWYCSWQGRCIFTYCIMESLRIKRKLQIKIHRIYIHILLLFILLYDISAHS